MSHPPEQTGFEQAEQGQDPEETPNHSEERRNVRMSGGQAIFHAWGTMGSSRGRFVHLNLAGVGLLAVLFFFPWLNLSCANQWVSAPSGFNIATGVVDSQFKKTLQSMEGPDGSGDSSGFQVEAVGAKYFSGMRPGAIAYAAFLMIWGVWCYRLLAAHYQGAVDGEPRGPEPIRARSAWICMLLGFGCCLAMMGAYGGFLLDFSQMDNQMGDAGAWSYAMTGSYYGALFASGFYGIFGWIVASALTARQPVAKSASTSKESHNEEVTPETVQEQALRPEAMAAPVPVKPKPARPAESGLGQMGAAFILGLAMMAVVMAYVVKTKYGPQPAQASSPEARIEDSKFNIED